MKFTLTTLICFCIFTLTANAQNKDTKKLVVQAFSEKKIEAYNTETEELIGTLPITFTKSTLKEVRITLKGEGLLDLTIVLPTKEVLEINVFEVHKAKIAAERFIPYSGISTIKPTVCDVFMLPKASESLQDPLKLILLPIENRIKNGTLIGKDQSGQTFSTVAEGMAYDPIFGANRNLRKQMCNLLGVNNILIVNCDGLISKDYGPKTRHRQFVTVKPVIEDFVFKTFYYLFKSDYYKYGFYNLRMRYVFDFGNGKSESVDIVNYGFYNASEPNVLFNKAIFDNASICISDSSLIRKINAANDAYKLEYEQYRLPIKTLPAVKGIELKEQIRRNIQSVVTIDGAENSFGSGFLINDSGYILTNYHVIEDANEIKVRVGKDTTSFIAELVRYDIFNDLALIQIPKYNTPYLQLSNESNYEVGESVVAIGTPASKDLGQTVSKGIISGVRKIELRELIQTDVSINPGNSGGPLLNEQGEVVGIVAMKISGRGLEGLGFAIPAYKAIQLMNIDYRNQ
ncbi:MAG: trypsin-like peptidase domain-containing protein [Bacteroidia bacterium]|jgi:hypothetical protein|nr:trypsin-like peptidase domain-containing protein [Bacteroidia bacterium]